MLNGAIVLNSLQYTKTLQGQGQYAFPETSSLSSSPTASPFTASSYVPFTTVPSTNGGGVSFTSGFTVTAGGSNYDNIMQVTSTQLPTLLTNWGGYGETTELWLTGFPVFDQGPSGSQVNQFMLMSTGGAYEAYFNNPIQNSIANGAVQINAPIRFLGQNYTIINATGPSGANAGVSTKAVPGGKIFLASALAPIQTVYVGHNISSSPWTVTLQDLGQPNSNGVSTASIAVYYNGALDKRILSNTRNNNKVQRNRQDNICKCQFDIRRIVCVPEVGKDAVIY